MSPRVWIRARTGLMVMLLWGWLEAAAQPHVVREGGHELRVSTVAASNLPQAMRDKHGIPYDPHLAVVNVSVMRTSDEANLEADVTVQARNLYGVQTPIAMRRTDVDGWVSYLGIYRFLPREVLEFSVTASPRGTDRVLRLDFQDRLVAPRR